MRRGGLLLMSLADIDFRKLVANWCLHIGFLLKYKQQPLQCNEERKKERERANTRDSERSRLFPWRTKLTLVEPPLARLRFEQVAAHYVTLKNNRLQAGRRVDDVY